VVKFRITVNATLGGSTSPAPGIYEYESGTTITVTATPLPGYSFDCWVYNSKKVGTWYDANPLSITVSEEADLTAYFQTVPAPPPGKVKLTIAKEGLGDTTPSPGEHYYDRNCFVEVTARNTGSNFGYVFDHWSFNGSTFIVNPAYVKMITDYTLTAHFVSDMGSLECHVYVDSQEVNADVSVRRQDGGFFHVLADDELTGQYEYVGRTPFKIGIGPPGIYVLTVKDQTKTVQIETGKASRVDFGFAAPPPKAEIAVSAYFDSTEVVASYEVRDYYTDELVASGDTPGTVKVDPGTYKVLCTYQGRTQSKDTGRLEAGQAIFLNFFFGITQYGRIEARFYDDEGEVVWPERDGDVYWLLYTKEGVNLGKFYAGMGVDVVPGEYVAEAYYYGRRQTKRASVKAGVTVRLDFDYRTRPPVKIPLFLIPIGLGATVAIVARKG
jgi:hypothetical protein